MTIEISWVQISVPAAAGVTATLMPGWWVLPQEPIDAVAHLPVNIRQVTATGPRWWFDLPRILLIAHIDPGASHGFHHAIVLELAVDLADGVAMQSGLHRQLARTG